MSHDEDPKKPVADPANNPRLSKALSKLEEGLAEGEDPFFYDWRDDSLRPPQLIMSGGAQSARAYVAATQVPSDPGHRTFRMEKVEVAGDVDPRRTPTLPGTRREALLGADEALLGPLGFASDDAPTGPISVGKIAAYSESIAPDDAACDDDTTVRRAHASPVSRSSYPTMHGLGASTAADEVAVALGAGSTPPPPATDEEGVLAGAASAEVSATPLGIAAEEKPSLPSPIFESVPAAAPAKAVPTAKAPARTFTIAGFAVAAALLFVSLLDGVRPELAMHLPNFGRVASAALPPAKREIIAELAVTDKAAAPEKSATPVIAPKNEKSAGAVVEKSKRPASARDELAYPGKRANPRALAKDDPLSELPYLKQADPYEP